MTGPDVPGEEPPSSGQPDDQPDGWARYHPAFLVLLGLATITGVVRLVLAVLGGLGWFAVLVSALIVVMLVSGVVWQLRLMRREERRGRR
ncbi:MAG: hypothetical protein QJR09_00355 [Micrococcus sp.]|nr:hypothetical protein [Micrococcus sp.]